jgi:hypothetical protein
MRLFKGVSRARCSGSLRRMGSLYRVGRYILRPRGQGAHWWHGPALDGYIKAADSGPTCPRHFTLRFPWTRFTFLLQAASRRHRGVAITSISIGINQARPRGQLRRLIWHEPERAVPCSTSPATFIDLSPLVSPFSPSTLLIPRAESCVYGSSVRDACLFVFIPGRDSESLRVSSLSVPPALFVTMK